MSMKLMRRAENPGCSAKNEAQIVGAQGFEDQGKDTRFEVGELINNYNYWRIEGNETVGIE